MLTTSKAAYRIKKKSISSFANIKGRIWSTRYQELRQQQKRLKKISGAAKTFRTRFHFSSPNIFLASSNGKYLALTFSYYVDVIWKPTILTSRIPESLVDHSIFSRGNSVHCFIIHQSFLFLLSQSKSELFCLSLLMSINPVNEIFKRVKDSKKNEGSE